MNSIGQILRLTTFGESHGAAIGGILDGFPTGITIDMDFVQQELNKRRPGQSAVTTGRQETDKVEFLSGIMEGVSTGTPIAFIVRNADHHSSDYDNLKDLFRPSHADFTYLSKYGIRDHRGGGRASARTTIAQCVAGALAKLALRQLAPQMDIYAFCSQIGPIYANNPADIKAARAISDSNAVRCPDSEAANKMESLIKEVHKELDSIGGVVSCIIENCPVGLGEPLFDKLHARLGYTMLNINAAKGFEYGDGFDSATQRGSYHNDSFATDENGNIATTSNHSGGIQGGISNGQTISFRVAFKPTPTIGISQQTVDKNLNAITLEAKGRHDPCVVPRAVPVVENCAAFVILDSLLMNKIWQ